MDKGKKGKYGYATFSRSAFPAIPYLLGFKSDDERR